MIRFTAPAALVGLLALPLLALALRGRGRRRALVALRTASVALLVLGAAGMEMVRAVPDLTVVIAADRSDSLGPDGARAIRAFLDEVRTRAGGSRRVGLVTFGATAMLEEPPNAQPRLALASRVRGDGTNIAGAIRAALRVLPEGSGGRIVVLTDGQATAGDLPSALAEVYRRGVELAVVPVAPDPPPPDVMIEEVSMPALGAVGERLPVAVTIRATAPAEGALRVRANGALLLARTLSLPVGRTRIDLEPEATAAGLLRIEASIDATPDEEPGNNRAFALGFVSGPPSVLYVAVQPGPLVRALDVQGLRVRQIAPAALPGSLAGYQSVAAVVLDDVPAYLLSAKQQASLRDYVRLAGGGLVAVGGTQSFGIGGYAGTPIEEALPVSMDVRHRLAIPTMAIVLVLDASGSMGSFGTELAKVELAKETAQSVVDLLGDRDLIGVLAFDQQPRWLVRPTPATERARILEAVSRIKAGGGTVLYPALEAARDALRQVDARVKHVIVLSDGQTDPGAFQTLVTGMAAERMTVSTVAIGRDADVEIMRNIAAWGRGRTYVARDIYGIPQILTAEAMLAARAYVVEERFVPKRTGTPGAFGDLGAVPALLGYLAAAPKPAAEVALLSHQDDPVAASWTYGLGRAVAITTDARYRWTAEWARWPQAARFWSQAVRWAMARQAQPLDVHAEPVPDGLRVALDARAPDGEPYVGWDGSVALIGDSGIVGAARLSQRRPGWYDATLPMPSPGAYLIRLTVSDSKGNAGRAMLPLAVPYSPELRHVGLNRAVISQMVETGGARVITTPREAMAPPQVPARRSQPTWPLCAGLALTGFVAEVVLRRIPAIENHLGRLAAATAAFVRREPSPEQVAGDAEYAAADRWRIEEPAEAAARAASMEAAARLYIARLRRQQSDEGNSGSAGR
ncbi:MAG: VWA domain-containing protein [Armatimonadota bacterium]|nr:VWA domain-containing protein [Armatimonadota bacterium]